MSVANTSTVRARGRRTHKAFLYQNITDDINDEDPMVPVAGLHGSHVVKNAQDCVDKIMTLKANFVLTIVASLCEEVVLEVAQSSSYIYSIYILDKKNDFPELKQRIEKYNKVKGIYSSRQLIANAIRNNQVEVELENIPISVFQAVDGSSSESPALDTMFIYCRILNDILLHMDYEADAKCKLTELCMRKYIDNPTVMRTIAEFDRNYEKYSPAWWYTRDSFLYRTINTALRAHDIDAITKFGFFIKELHNQLQLFPPTFSTPFIVFRGQG